MQPAQRGIAAALILLCLGLLPSQAFACHLVKGESVVVDAIADDATLTLADGRSVKLTGIDVLSPHAASLAALAGQDVTLRYDGTRRDRYGRVLAFVMLSDGASLQERLIAEGAARVAPSRDMRLCVGGLLDIEARARATRRGIWSDPAHAVRQADDIAALNRLEGSYHLVEGVVKSASNIRGRIYINFGDDWREDFTVTVAPADAKLFKGGMWPRLIGQNSELAGTKIRVRGYLSRYYGPGIVVSVPEQIEFPDRAMADEGSLAADGGGSGEVPSKMGPESSDAQR